MLFVLIRCINALFVVTLYPHSKCVMNALPRSALMSFRSSILALATYPQIQNPRIRRSHNYHIQMARPYTVYPSILYALCGCPPTFVLSTRYSNTMFVVIFILVRYASSHIVYPLGVHLHRMIPLCVSSLRISL